VSLYTTHFNEYIASPLRDTDLFLSWWTPLFAINITLYRLPDSEWVIELPDEENARFVLEELYPSEESAYAVALEAIREGVMDASISTLTT
jgi:hypothetical protein